jgi:hypothetical protein
MKRCFRVATVCHSLRPTATAAATAIMITDCPLTAMIPALAIDSGHTPAASHGDKDTSVHGNTIVSYSQDRSSDRAQSAL